MTRDEDAADSHAPVFFVSYAQFTTPHLEVQEPNQYVMEFFDELSGNVSQLLGRRTGEYPGFLDRTLVGGQRWTRELFLAAATCQVFVPLVSPGLLRSEWCAMEWDVFARRTVVRRKGTGPVSESCILPVVWIHTELDELPPVIRGIQLFSPVGLPDPAYARQYLEDGLFGLRQLGQNPVYRAVVWRLAQRIVQIYRTHRAVPLDPVPTNTDGLTNVFANQQEVA
ncbi:toll/interleukin-1 receptor domain-containing protein [Micromonospora sp. CPCC 205371]|nr:toll/interleukin-1 receptor domain-containing protein [Micromonospora sp. CPCC 205371]